VSTPDDRPIASLLAAAPAPGDDRCRCALCESAVDPSRESFVAVAPTPDAEPGACLCEGCYEHVVEDRGIVPTTVFKSGHRRTAVLPVARDH
jgi:hypothetical protein